ncbi:MAG: transporter substrate-binding domain-containing protein [Candidatus Bathyarchaeota archaeon]|nr:transporter substrate-binding domain-containing protein [Candidatus Bathyarchaeota archaeon]MDH5494159.1 transporter substrate-binding domain-containing protein [Candidatus Bathyarchaeota archaeon]
METKVVYAVIGIIMLCVGFAGGYLTTRFLLPPTGGTLLATIQDRGYMIVGTSADYPPFEFINETTHEISGFDVEVANAIGEELGVEVQWQDMDFDALIAACKGGQIDMIAAGMSLKPDRMDQLDYTISVFTSERVVVVSASSSVEVLDSLADMGTLDLQIGVQSGTVQADQIQDLVDAGDVDPAKVSEYPKVDLMVLDLDAGRLDAVYIEKGPADAFGKQYPLRYVYSEKAFPEAFWVRKNEPEFRDAVNKAIWKLLTEEIIDDLIVKWFG